MLSHLVPLLESSLNFFVWSSYSKFSLYVTIFAVLQHLNQFRTLYREKDRLEQLNCILVGLNLILFNMEGGVSLKAIAAFCCWLTCWILGYHLPLLYRNAHLWLQVLLNHFCLGGCKLVNHDGCIYELKSFVDTLQVACARLKMHHAWAIFASTEDYLSRFPHMTQLWQVILTLPASTTTVVERGHSQLKILYNLLGDVL